MNFDHQIRFFFIVIAIIFTAIWDVRGQCNQISDILYYGTQSNSSLSTVTTDGSSNQTIINGLASQIRRIRVDAKIGLVFWTAGSTNAIYSSNLDGTNLTQIISGLANPNSLALDTRNNIIYFGETNTQTLWKVNYDGTGLMLINASPGLTQGLVVDEQNDYLYWTDFSTGNINRSDLDGSNQTLIYNAGPQVFDLVLSLELSRLFFTHRSDNTLRCINLDGTNEITLFMTPNTIGVLEHDAENNIVYLSSTAGEIYSVSYDGVVNQFFTVANILAGIGMAVCPEIISSDEIPTMGEWGLIILGLCFLSFGATIIHDRKYHLLNTN